MSTGIPYCDEVWNPVIGCRPVSEGCRHCWAARFAHRGMCEQHCGLTRMGRNGPVWNGKVNLVHRALDVPKHWRAPRKIFVGSMTDIFYEKVPLNFLAEIFCTIAECRRHTFLLLTKRIRRAVEFFRATRHAGWPLRNLWLLTSAEDQKTYDERVSLLVHDCPEFVKGVSLEPLLGPVTLKDKDRLHLSWVIVGGESGPGARPMKMSWAKSLLDECRNSGIAFFMKQTGTVLASELGLDSRDGSNPKEWERTLRVRQYPERDKTND
jgi:protein gp37